jgi:hypothetical protein
LALTSELAEFSKLFQEEEKLKNISPSEYSVNVYKSGMGYQI